ncbi:MAG: DUF502 domain-containing protein [FCB group bacterium]|nr:DUF502 domain-containing protein [FCB group bacterium]
MLSRRRRRQMSPFARARHDIQGRVMSGLIVLVPIGITFFILNFLFSVTIGMIKPITMRFLPALPEYVLNTLSICVLLLALYFVGLFAANFAGRRLIALGEAILARIPIVKTIYAASKQVVDTFSMRDKTSSMRSVALVEFPSAGLRSIGFVTGTILDEHGVECHRVFVPTTPNPTSGFFLIVPKEKVFFTGMNVEETCKMLMSGGIIGPERICPLGTAAETIVDADCAEEDATV